MPPAPSTSAIALYRLCPDWQAVQNLPESDDKRKIVNAVNADSSRKKQPHATVYVDKREKALRRASRVSHPPVRTSCTAPGDEADILDLGTPTAVKDGPPPSSAVESRLRRLEHQVHELHQRANLLSGQGLVEKLRPASSPTSSNAAPCTAVRTVEVQPSVIDLAATPRCRAKRESDDNTTGAPTAKKARPPPSAGDELVKQLRVEQTSLLPVPDHGGRCALAAVLVALDKADPCRQDLAKRLEQWTEPMWTKHVPARLRQHHWTSGRSSFRTYLDLLGGSARLDQCVLYLASIEYEVSIHVVTAGRRLTIARVHTGCKFPRHIVLLHTVEGDHYEVLQHKDTTVFDNDQHKDLLLRRLMQLPTADLPPIADPEVDEPELETGGYQKAPTLIGQGAFSSVYRVATKDPCAHPRWHALKIVSDDKHAVKMVKLEADVLKKLAEHPGVPRLWQLVSERALSMEYCVGGSLEKVMEKPLPLAVCVEVFRQLLCTISHAHEAGLLHRDIKPANILLRHKLVRTSQPHDVDVVLADWGLATSDKRDRCGGLVGTPRYLPPEVVSKEQPFDATCDVWAAGYVLAQLLRDGEPLFAGEVGPKWQEQLETRLSDISHDAIRKLLRAVLSPRSERPDASKVLRLLPSIVV